MRILGIDQSLRETGWYCVDTTTGDEQSGTIEPDKALSSIDRLNVLDGRFQMLLDEQKPQTVAIEDYGFAAAGRARELGELGGILRLRLLRSGIKTFVVGVGTLKKFVTGKGKGEKDLMLLYAFKNFGMEFTNHNICDAFGLCMLTCCRETQANIHLPKRLTQPQQESILVPKLLFPVAEITARTRQR